MQDASELIHSLAKVAGGFALLLGSILLGWFLLWHTAIKRLPPVQEALGLRRPAKPFFEEKRDEIEALKREHARLQESFRRRPTIGGARRAEESS